MKHLKFGRRQKLVTGNLVKLRADTKQEAIRVVQRLHRNLGHPSTKELTELLAARGANEEVLRAARSYVCVACAKYKKPADAAPASLPVSTKFNDALQADVFWLRLKNAVKYPVLSAVDLATRYAAAVLLRSEQSEEHIRGLERCWIAHFGAPQRLVTDEGRGWLSQTFETWTNAHGIEHTVAPGEAHERLAIVERRHAILRKSIEVYMDDVQLNDASGIKEALTYCVPQINGTPSVAGFSPTQWVLGHQPQLAGSLLGDNFRPGHFGGHEAFEAMLNKRTAAQKALIEADADRRLRRALGAKYKGLNSEYSLGQQVWFWRDAKQPDLVKIRWLGPAQIVMKEFKADDTGQQRVNVYWLAYKTQLIRCAPHHVRADVKSSGHALDDVQKALTSVRQLKSRGVTRYYDLHHLNKRNLAEVETDEHAEELHGDVMEEDSDHEMTPPRRRPRLLPPGVEPPQASETAAAPTSMPPGISSAAPAVPSAEEYEPTSPAHTEQQDIAPPAAAADTNDAAAADTQTPGLLPRVPSSISISEPSEEPPAISAAPTPHASRPQASMTQERPSLDPVTAQLYETVAGETFQQRRARLNKQETLSFAPFRSRAKPPDTRPYDPEHHSARPKDEHELAGQAFYLDDLDTKMLPSGWFMDEHGFLQLHDRTTDYWELKAGCLIRHHVVPRRGRLHLEHLPKDCPVSPDQLDSVRVTLIHQGGGKSRLTTDSGYDGSPPPGVEHTWTGATIFQLNGNARRELAMYSGHHQFTSAKQQGKDQKLAKQKKFKKEKNAVNERALGPQERAMFKEAKVKELKSFFDHHVWIFQSTKEADPSRTLTSRILLKWSRNPDGSPRAKARLIVRGFADPDTLAGSIETSSPTTTRLSRSMLLSLATTMSWTTWTADVSTAFLQGREQDRKLWVKLPSEALALLGADEDARMLLLKPCYGQIDAPRGWYLEAVDRLRRGGLRQHALDPCAFLIYETDDDHFNEHDPIHQQVNSLGSERLVGMVIMHVDDLLGAGCPNSPRYAAVVEQLKENFSFREWKEDLEVMEYCGCELQRTPEGGRKLHQGKYFDKVKPIAYDKKLPLHQPLNEREVTQLRGLLGSLQWPAVQTSPHLQCSASLMAAHVSNATLQTVQDCNRLLKFAKENKDIGLVYNHLGPAEKLRLLCFFDAGFSTRLDGSSQGGYVLMMVNEDLMHSAEEGEYHILDWRSFKTPRVARSSLGAEAQAGGQASDAVDFACRFWHHLMEPHMPLKQLLEVQSSLKPVMITDAKALYDAFHREGASSSVVDKRVSLEIRAMKERLLELGGNLKWMSSDRQIADGLTKESARALFAARLKHQKLKLTWDPTYKAMKKKTKDEKNTALAETTSQVHHQKPDDFIPRSEEIMEDEFVGPEEFVNFAHSTDMIPYVLATSHVAKSRMKYDTKGRSKNFMFWMIFLFLLQCCQAAPSTCLVDETPPRSQLSDEIWLALFAVAPLAIAVIAFLLGRWSKGEKKGGKEVKIEEEKVTTVDAFTQKNQKDEPIVHARLREALKSEQARVNEYKMAARESRRAVDLAMTEILNLRPLVQDAAPMFRRLITAMDDHMDQCPHRQPIVASRKNGICWHFPTCHCAEQITEPNLLHLRICAYCGDHRSPLDFPSPSPSSSQGDCLRDEVATWLADGGSLRYLRPSIPPGIFIYYSWRVEHRFG